MNLDAKTIFDIFGTVGMLTAAGTFIISQARVNDMKLLRSDNNDLRASLKDKATKIADLEREVEELAKKVAIIEAKNGDLANLVKDALVMYFQKNPKVAENLDK